MSDAPLSVVVIMGGTSLEHDTSMASGSNILRSLNGRGHLIGVIEITKLGEWRILHQSRDVTLDGEPDQILTESEALNWLSQTSAVAVLALHGSFGEDGQLQALLEAKGILYTGSDSRACSVAMDKIRAASAFRAMSLSVPEFASISKQEFEVSGVKAGAFERLGFPLIIKPATEGSSIGLSLVQDAEAIPAALTKAFLSGEHALIQQYISGREITVTVLDDAATGETRALIPTEILVDGVFDTDAKYNRAEELEITPPNMNPDEIAKVQSIAIKAHKSVAARGVSRTDMIVSESGEIYVLEVNMIPGMTSASLVPKALAAEGHDLEYLVKNLVTLAQQGER